VGLRFGVDLCVLLLRLLSVHERHTGVMAWVRGWGWVWGGDFVLAFLGFF